MMPGAMHSVDVTMANPGSGVVQCRVADHIAAGMQALVVVERSTAVETAQQAAATGAAVRRYFVAAEAVEWDYTPSGRDGCTNSTFG